MSKSKTQPVPNVMSNPFEMSDAADRAAAFWAAQGAALERTRGFFDAWCVRRQDAAAAAADCCAVMSNGGDLAAASKVWTAWVSGSMERLREDLQAQTTLATELASEMTGAFSPNGKKPARRKPHSEPAAEHDAAPARSSADIR
jgi:hypothetical protein